MAKIIDILTDAAMEIGVEETGSPLSSDDAKWILRKLNRLLESWNTRRINAYNINFTTYTLTPNKNPHTIGPTLADFTVAQRPVVIEAANIIYNSVTPSVKIPLNLRNDEWWATQRVPALTSNFPVDLYYSPDMPNGSIYLWPVPTIAYGLELETWVPLGQVAMGDDVTFPPGYQEAITLSLAESIAPSFEKPISPDLARMAQMARMNIQSLNASQLTIHGADKGLPTEGRSTSFWDFVSGKY